ncbi:MAG: PH domain-containing protein [Clostridium sp.]|nr:PH domain-containing protein [Clostridium sp.]
MAETNTFLWKDRKHHLWFPISFTSYYIENDRLMIKEGFLNTTINETLLYRIVDLTFHQTLAGKIFGTGDIIVKAKVDSSPEIILKNIAKPMEVRKLLSQAVEESRQRRNVVGKEFYSGEPMHRHMDLNDDGVCDFDGDDM